MASSSSVRQKPGGPSATGAVREWRTFGACSNRLDAQQRLTWIGAGPSGTPPASLADVMQRLHFAVVERFGFGVIRVRSDPGRVVCALPGGVPALVFEEEATTWDDRTVERRWRIAGGLMVRRQFRTDLATFALGIRLPAPGRGQGEYSAWVRADGVPSRFLVGSRLPMGRSVATVYTTFHAHVSFAYLGTLKRTLMAGADRPQLR